jgi:ABC-2 type transport system permease protein
LKEIEVTRLIAIELVKLRTIRSTWLVLGIQQATVIASLSVLVVVGADLHAPTAVRQFLSQAGFMSSLFSLVLGILAVAGEYRHRTITDTYLATPRRSRVIAAKLVALTWAGAAFGALSALTAVSVTAAAMSTKGTGLDLSSIDTWRGVVGVVAGNALYAAIGVSVGALVRNPTGAIAAALLWVTLAEGIMASLLRDLSQWLPNASLLALDYSPGRMATSAELLPQWGGAVVLAAYAAVFALLAAATSVRRDVT